jgi:nucleotide-binding universal stress UspA family protein
MLIPASAQPVSTHSHAPILIAYDGSPASSRAVHVFALLGLAKGRVVHVLTQDDESRAQAVTTAQKACALLSLHGAVKTHAIGLGDAEAGRPAETILGTATALQPDLVVMGAYGRRGIQEIFGSCTRQVLDASTTPLFLYH